MSHSPRQTLAARFGVNANLVAGACSGIATTAMLHPFDCVKTRFQVHEGRGAAGGAGGAGAGAHSVKDVVPKYSSTLNAFRTILRQEGARALYQGVPTAMLGSGIAWGMYFMLYEKGKAFVRQRKCDEAHGEEHGLNRVGAAGAGMTAAERSKKLPPWQHMLCGSAAGVCTVFMTNPIWLIKTRLQLQVLRSEKDRLGLPKAAAATAARAGKGVVGGRGEVYYRGFLHAVRTIVRDEGPMALYKGLVPALFLVSHGAIHFTIYEELKSLSANYREDGQMGRFDPLVLGAASKAVASTVTFPYQTVKARMQRRVVEGELPFKGMWDCTVRTWRGEGWRGFFKGLAPKTWQIMPQAGMTFFLYETIKKMLTEKDG
jgi:solute carrier family 25 folate transporter 32